MDRSGSIGAAVVILAAAIGITAPLYAFELAGIKHGSPTVFQPITAIATYFIFKNLGQKLPEGWLWYMKNKTLGIFTLSFSALFLCTTLALVISVYFSSSENRITLAGF